MPLNNVRWGDNIAAAIKALNVSDQQKISDMQLKLLWRAMAGESITEVGANADVAPGAFQIINPENNQIVPVTGVGGHIT